MRSIGNIIRTIKNNYNIDLSLNSNIIAMSVGLALSAASLAGNIFGNIMSAKQNREIDDILAGRMNDLQARFDKDYNTQFFDTDQAKSVIQTLSNQHERSNKRIENAGAISGASAEAKVAQRAKSQEVFGDSLTKLAGYGTQYKDMKERQFNRRDDTLQNFYLQHEMRKADNWSNFMNNASNVGQGGIAADAVGGGNGQGSIFNLWGKEGFGKGII